MIQQIPAFVACSRCGLYRDAYHAVKTADLRLCGNCEEALRRQASRIARRARVALALRQIGAWTLLIAAFAFAARLF